MGKNKPLHMPAAFRTVFAAGRMWRCVPVLTSACDITTLERTYGKNTDLKVYAFLEAVVLPEDHTALWKLEPAGMADLVQAIERAYVPPTS